VFDEEEYERNLQRWSVMELPAFRISDWDGTWSDGSVGGVALSMTSDGLSAGEYGDPAGQEPAGR
jgi:hypothetical protein